MYSYIMGLDEELWDILEDGVCELALDEEGVVVDRKKHTPAQKKLYKKHHKIRGIIVVALPRTEYLKMIDKSTAKAMFASLCENYEKSMEKSKKPTFKSNKFRKQIKQGLMATWEDLDSESESDKDEAGNEANVGVGLVATVTSVAEPVTDSEDENEVYSKIPKEELIDSLKELLTHF